MPKGWVDAEGTVASVDVTQGRSGNMYAVVFTYVVDTHFYGGTYHTTEEYREGDTIYLAYDPSDPEKNSLAQLEERNRWIVGVLIVVAVIVVVLVTMMSGR